MPVSRLALCTSISLTIVTARITILWHVYISDLLQPVLELTAYTGDCIIKNYNREESELALEIIKTIETGAIYNCY